MKKIVLPIVIFILSNCSAQGEFGGSISYSGIKTYGIDFFAGLGDSNRYHIGFGFQFSNTYNTIVSERKSNYGLTKLDSGDYIFIIDIGYSRVLYDRITINPELSYGVFTEFTNYLDRRFKDDGYSLINNRESEFGVGINIGCIVYDNIEPFIGYNSYKNFVFGLRYSIREMK